MAFKELNYLKAATYPALIFFEQFGRPLTLDEIFQFQSGGMQLNKDQILEALRKDSNLFSNNEYFCFSDNKNLILDFQKRQIISKTFWKRCEFFLPFINLLPFVEMVAVCNTLAFDSSYEDSDIDLFIVTTPGRIFTARTLVTILFNLLGVRRHGKKVSGRFCLSFFIARDGLNIQSIGLKEDIYLPFWIKTLKVVYGKPLFLEFIKDNSWINQYFASPVQLDESHLLSKPWFSFIGRALRFVLGGRFGDIVENKLSKINLRRYQKNMLNFNENSSIIVNDKILKYHNVDRRVEITKKFRARLESLLSK